MAPTPATRYLEAVGRRKTSSARVRLLESKTATTIMINDTPVAEYFPTDVLRKKVTDVIGTRNLTKDFTVTAKVSGGGIASQAGAVAHAIARALLEHDPELRLDLKKTGLLKRDPRMKERRKFGLKKARKAPQWSKR